MLRKKFEKMFEEFVPRFNRRGTDGFITEYYKNKPIVGCEVGIDNGIHLRDMLKLHNIEKLYAVDINLSKCDYKNDKIVFLKGNAIEMSDYIPDNSLDFVYIDSGHGYHTLLEMLHYFPKVKQGGIIGGHDFRASDSFVFQGVIFFCFLYNLDFFGGEKEDWWMIKSCSNEGVYWRNKL